MRLFVEFMNEIDLAHPGASDQVRIVGCVLHRSSMVRVFDSFAFLTRSFCRKTLGF